MISLINRAIDLILQGAPRGAETVLERARDEAIEMTERIIQMKSELEEKSERLDYWIKRARAAEDENEQSHN